jgi:uncharacterized surface protein with fasciclin (FAS1) repeats
MIRILRLSIPFLILVLIITSCKKKIDDYYATPAGLGDPIYQTLQAKGNFKHYLALVDRAGYKEILSTTGWFTVFAPNDAAFTKYFTDNGITTDAAISDSLAKGIVKFSLVYNAYRRDQLSIYQIAGLDGGNPGMGYKRKTTYYDGVQEKGDAVHKKIIATNRNNTTSDGKTTATHYVDGDNNNKYIPYFTDVFLGANSLSATDYNAFYPNTTFTGFNVCGATVVNQDIISSNGIIHEIDKVLTPLLSFDQYIRSNPNYSDFKLLMDSLAVYVADVTLTQNNLIATGSTDSVYVKSYDGRLAFCINNENYQNPLLSASSFINTGGQAAGWSMVVPTNAALKAYRQKILSKFGNSFFKTAPSSVVVDFINSLMWPSNLWPSQFSLISNYELEPTTVGMINVVDKQILSNGTFYGSSVSQQANVFRTVYGVQYLDPKCSITLHAYSFGGLPIKGQITQPGVKNTLLLMSDDVLTANGWTYNEGGIGSTTTAWGYKAASSGSYSYSNPYEDVIFRMFQTGVLPNIDLPSLSGSGIVETINHEFIKYNNNKIQTSGTLDAGVDLNILKTDATSVNGTVYYVDGMLSFTNNNVGYHLQKLAALYPASYSSFYYFLSTAPTSLYNASTQAIAGLNTSTDANYTILVPTNAAIKAAIMAGLLPGTKATGALPTSAPSSASDMDLVRKFILYHIINGTSLDVDLRTRTDNYTTMLQNENGASTFLNVSNQPGQMIIVDNQGRLANVITDNTSNQLSNRTIIQSIDNYLNY